MFRQGNLYIEQQISDKESFGIVDRMIVSDNLITIIDYKSVPWEDSGRKYDEQLKCYTKIMETLYPQRRVEYYMLSNRYLMIFMSLFIVETPIPKAKRSGIGKLNNPAKRRV